ncbi:MAG: hypothetical protein E6Q98_02905 [Rhodospirillaceae bacterium]|nr:MAG: hypothetical protein E6Q98_02905 [Rhodospirillaceae bacterium]
MNWIRNIWAVAIGWLQTTLHACREAVMLPVIFAGGAWSWCSYLLGTKDPQNVERLQHFWGWFHPSLDEHWCRLFLDRPLIVADRDNVKIVTGGATEVGPMTVTDDGWLSLLAVWRKEAWYHRLKNIGSEWARLDAQRAYKAAAFVSVGLFALGCGIGAVISMILRHLL